LVTAFFAGAALTATFATVFTGALARGAVFLTTFFGVGLRATFFAVAAALAGAASLAGTAVTAFAGAAEGVAFSDVTMLYAFEVNGVNSLYRLIHDCQDGLSEIHLSHD